MGFPVGRQVSPTAEASSIPWCGKGLFSHRVKTTQKFKQNADFGLKQNLFIHRNPKLKKKTNTGNTKATCLLTDS